MLKHLLSCCFILLAFCSFGQCQYSISGTQQICSNSYATLTADYAGTGQISWSIGGGGNGYFSSTIGSTVNYFPSASDSNAVMLKATVIDSAGSCDGAEEYFPLTIQTFSYIGAADQTLCPSADSVFLSAQFNNSPVDTLFWNLHNATGTLSNEYGSSIVYYPSVADVASGAVYLTLFSTSDICPVYDSVYIYFTNTLPTVNAGLDESICTNANPKYFHTVATGANFTEWTTSGTGTFTTPYADSTTYYPSQADVENGSVTLTLQATGCGTASDSKVVTYTAGPQLEIGSDQYLASQNYLSATFANANGVIWSTSGVGTLSSTTSANTSYIPSPAENFVIIYATTVGAAGTCEEVTDYLYLYRDTVNCSIDAGPDQAKCLSDTIFLLAPQDFDTIEWSVVGNGNLENPYSPTAAKYTPAGTDNNTTVYFILFGSKDGCSVADTMKVAFSTTNPTAFAGADRTVCKNEDEVNLYGYSSSINKTWATTGTGFFLDVHDDSTVYVPSYQDKQNGSAILTLSAYGCGFDQDSVTVAFNPGPTVEAGPNQLLTLDPVSLSATATVASGVTWTSSGGGTFANANALVTTYTPSQTDVDTGFVLLTVTTTGNGSCPASSDFLILTGNAQVCNVTISKTESANTVNFNATNTDGQSVGSYYWDFGDSTYAYGKVASHVYAETGTFLVTLNFTTPNGLCSAVAQEVVTITNIAVTTHSVSGTIYAGSNAVDYAFVTLFELKNNVYKYIQSVELSSSDQGNYTFTNVTDGQYLVYAIPSTLSSYVNYIACYFPNVTVWLGASTIDVNDADETGKNIYLLRFTPPSDGWDIGTAGISGTITFDANTTLRTTSSSANPSQYAVISLYNTNGELLATTNTDEFGNYSFAGIAAGNYVIKVEYPGGKSGSTSYPVTTASGQVAQVNTEITRQEVVVGTEKEAVLNSVSFYPNPVQDVLHISLSSSTQAQVQFYNSLGALVCAQNVEGSAKIEMNDLPSGIYSYILIQGEQKFSGKVVKY